MARKGHEVTVLSLTGNKSFYCFDDKVNVRFLDLPPLPGGKTVSRLKAAMSRALSVRAAVKKNSPDCVIGMSHIMSAYAFFSCVFTEHKSIGTERSNPYMLNATIFMTLLRRAMSLLCDGYIFQTEAAKHFFPKRAGKKCAVIPNAVFNGLVYELSPPDVREKTVTAAGRLVECKGFDVLIKAFSAVRKRFPDYRLVIYGSGEERGFLLNTAEAEGLSDAVSLPGALKDAMREICRSSVFVLSSRYEGMPNALIEAMACGVPCVSTRCKMGPEELIEDGVNGLLVPVNDAEAISRAVIRLIEDRELSERISSNSVKLKQKLSPEKITDRWLDYISGVINKH